MEMCPYCGEEVPDDSSRCWKCGTELSEGGARAASDDDEEMEVPPDDDEEEGASEKRQELVNCPFCDSPMPKSAMRCKECGRTVRAPEAARGAVAWKLGPWVAFLAVAVGAAIVVGIVAMNRIKTKQAASVADEAPIPNLKFKDLETRIGPTRKMQNEAAAAKRQEIWEQHFKDKYVSWEHWILKASKNKDGLLEIEFLDGDKPKPTEKSNEKPDVIVVFQPTDDDLDTLLRQSLKRGDRIAYTARLVGFGEGAAFKLDNAKRTK